MTTFGHQKSLHYYILQTVAKADLQISVHLCVALRDLESVLCFLVRVQALVKVNCLMSTKANHERMHSCELRFFHPKPSILKRAKIFLPVSQILSRVVESNKRSTTIPTKSNSKTASNTKYVKGMFLNAMQTCKNTKRSNKIQNASNCHKSQTASTTLATKPRPQQANTAQYARI